MQDSLNKLVRNILRCAKVPRARGIKGEVGDILSTDTLVVHHGAQVEESPSRCRGSSRDRASVGLQEVDDVQRIRISYASQESQPHEKKSCSRKEQAQKAHSRFYSQLVLFFYYFSFIFLFLTFIHVRH